MKLIKDMWIASPFRRESALFFEIFSNALETLKNLITGLPVNKLVVEVSGAKRARIEKTKMLSDNGPYLFPNQFDTFKLVVLYNHKLIPYFSKEFGIGCI